MTLYYFDQVPHTASDTGWQEVLGYAYSKGLKPLCGCKDPDSRSALYITKYRDIYYLKRMPLTGPKHALHCEHYEPPLELSGLSWVSNTAIKKDITSDVTTLALNFPLSKTNRRAPPPSEDGEKTQNESSTDQSVRADGTKLTLRGTLHYLYDQANLAQWVPAMAGKRNWFIVRRELVKAADNMRAKNKGLNELLFIPENFSLDRAKEIADRRVRRLSSLANDTSRKMLVVGEVKILEHATKGSLLNVKHLPPGFFRISDDLNKRIHKVFKIQLAMRLELENTRLLLIGVFSQLASGIYDLESACLMNVNEHWIPFECKYSYQLLTALHSNARRYKKSLRYNLPTSVPLAVATLTDTGEHPTALYVHTSGEAGDYIANSENLFEQSQVKSWFWETDTQALPDLPVATTRAFDVS